jgi:hypothetical protein
MNVWANPAYWPFTFLPTELATDVSAAIALGIFVTAGYIMARCFDVPVVPSAIGAQLSIFVFAPTAFLYQLATVFCIMVGNAVVYAPHMIAHFRGFSVATTSLSKKSLQAAERERADVVRARRRWLREQGMLDPARLVFIDETAVSTNMARLKGRAARGVRLIGRVPLGEWKTITFVAALRQAA